MSKELTSGSYIVGSDAYFRNINSKIFIGNFMSGSYDYRSALSKICSNISSALDTIYSDLSNFSRTLRYVDTSKLRDMEIFITGLGYIYNKYGSFGGKSSECCSLLNLNSFNTAKYSRASDREIDEAISFIKNNKYFSTSNSYDLVKRAIEWGISSSSNTDFLQDILGNYDVDFLKDVLTKYDFKDFERNFTGKNGKIICSTDYIKSFEKEIFGDNISSSMFNLSVNTYLNLISKSFEEVYKQFMTSLNDGAFGVNCMTKTNYNNMKTAFNELSYFKSSLNSYEFMKKLDSYYTDLLDEIEKIKEEASDLFIDTFDTWSSNDAMLYGLDIIRNDFTSFINKKISNKMKIYDQFQNINKNKETYVISLKSAINDVSKSYNLLPVMIGYVAFREFGGDPLWVDHAAHTFRNLIEDLELIKVSEQTSFGNISMQLRRATECLGYLDDLTLDIEKQMIKLLEDEKTAIILVARHLSDLKHYDFKNININELTDDEVAIVVGRYNVGYNPSTESALNSDYAKDFKYNKNRKFT